MSSKKPILAPSLASLLLAVFSLLSVANAATLRPQENLDLEIVTEIEFAEVTVLKSKVAPPMLHVVVYGVAPKTKYDELQLMPYAPSSESTEPTSLQFSVIGLRPRKVSNAVPTPFAVHTLYQDFPDSVEEVTIDWHTEIIKREDFRTIDIDKSP